MEKDNKQLLEKLKGVINDRSKIKDLTDEELNLLYSLANNSKNNVKQETNGRQMVKKNSQSRIDGFAGPVILATITLFFGIIFMLIIFR